jgi:hypothetical protein
MAKTLDKTNIILGNTILPGDVSQSIDAFTGEEEYDITLSGSFTLTGSLFLNNLPTSSTNVNLLTIDPITKQIQQTSSFDPGSTIDTGSFVIDADGQLNKIDFTLGDGTQFSASLEIDNLKQQEFQLSGSATTSFHSTQFISGMVAFSANSSDTDSARFGILTGKTLGVDAFITVTPVDIPTLGNSQIIGVKDILSDGSIRFFREGSLTDDETIMFIGTTIV